jgi:hypothetical protein
MMLRLIQEQEQAGSGFDNMKELLKGRHWKRHVVGVWLLGPSDL